MGDWLSFVANVLEIVGFLITLWVALAVKKIRDFYTATAMVPRLLERISGLAVALAEHYGSYESSTESISVDLGLLETNLKELAGMLPRGNRKSVSRLVGIIQGYDKPGGKNRERLWEIYSQTQRVIEETKNYQEKRKWQT